MSIFASTFARSMVGLLAGLATFDVTACVPIGAGDSLTLQDGVYCLVDDVVLDVNLVAVHMIGNTTLDCQGHKISDPSGTARWGVKGSGDNVTVKNCVFDGFDVAIYFAPATNYRIQNNVSINARTSGFWASGSHGLIARNIVRAPASSYNWAGIGARGIVDIIGNTVILGAFTPTDPSAYRVGISTDHDLGDVVAYNEVQAFAAADETGPGISSSGPGPVIYRNVVVANPGAGRVGIECNGSTVLKNLIAGLEPAYSYCTPYYETDVGLKARARRR